MFNKKIKKQKNNLEIKISILLLSFLPAITFAGDFKAAVSVIISYSQKITNALIGITLAFFFWGIFMMLSSGNNASVKEAAKQRVMWGIVILFILMSLWSILAFLKNTTNLVENKIDIDITKLPDAIN